MLHDTLKVKIPPALTRRNDMDMLARMTTEAGIVPPAFLSYYDCGYGSPTYMV